MELQNSYSMKFLGTWQGWDSGLGSCLIQCCRKFSLSSGRILQTSYFKSFFSSNFFKSESGSILGIKYALFSIMVFKISECGQQLMVLSFMVLDHTTSPKGLIAGTQLSSLQLSPAQYSKISSISTAFSVPISEFLMPSRAIQSFLPSSLDFLRAFFLVMGASLIFSTKAYRSTLQGLSKQSQNTISFMLLQQFWWMMSISWYASLKLFICSSTYMQLGCRSNSSFLGSQKNLSNVSPIFVDHPVGSGRHSISLASQYSYIRVFSMFKMPKFLSTDSGVLLQNDLVFCRLSGMQSRFPNVFQQNCFAYVQIFSQNYSESSFYWTYQSPQSIFLAFPRSAARMAAQTDAFFPLPHSSFLVYIFYTNAFSMQLLVLMRAFRSGLSLASLLITIFPFSSLCKLVFSASLLLELSPIHCLIILSSTKGSSLLVLVLKVAMEVESANILQNAILMMSMLGCTVSQSPVSQLMQWICVLAELGYRLQPLGSFILATCSKKP